MRKLAIVLLLAAIAACVSAAGQFDYYLYRSPGFVPFDTNGNPIMTLTIGTTPPAKMTETLVYLGQAEYNNSIFEMGWDQLNVAPDRKLFLNNISALQAWYGAGYLEGYATMGSISDVIIAQTYNYSANGQKWINDHVAFVRDNALSNTDCRYWRQVRKQLVQMQGIADGYNARAQSLNSSLRISFDIVYKINILNEYGDIAPAANIIYGKGIAEEHEINLGAFRKPRKVKAEQSPAVVPETEGHCSGLIKLTDSDLLMSHVTWSPYNIFVGRQYKTYYMETAVSMSSNAILINSGGDWYQSSNKISVIETTNEFTNTALYALIKPQCVSEFMRVMVANYLADTAQEWTELFAIHQSGTYCNQWMVLDYKLYVKGMLPSELPDGLFWIAEEIPGTVATGDLTGFIRQNGYWGSYNIPYFQNIYEASGFGLTAQAYGSFFSWFMCPRAQIFRRDHNKVVDLTTMQHMMRYNDWQHDPLSAIPGCTGCNPANSPMLGISSRGDLVPQDATWGNLNPNYSQDFAFNWFGATDAKISSYDLINNGFKASFINGPTHEQQPVFSWDVAPTNPLAQLPGMIQTFDFPWYTVKPTFNFPAPTPQVKYRNITVDVYRRNTTVNFDVDGVPQMRMVAGLRGAFAVTPDLIPLATAVYNESGLVTGFDQLSVSANQDLLFASDESAYQAWYGAGFAEGYASAEAIAVVNVWRNYTYTAASMQWVETHIQYMRTNSLTKFTPFWKQVRKQLIQMEGIADGMNQWYQNVEATFKPMTFLDVFMINFRDDNDDVISIVTAPPAVREELLNARKGYHGDHCSALVKVTDDDVLMSQATWAGYGIMIHKQIKTYIFTVTVTFSCNAGMIFSGDDWYQTSNKLGVQETTNEFKNLTLYDLIKPQCVSEFMRVMIANYLANTSKAWVDTYSTEPSGTYCNQWMVFDFKLYGPTVNQTTLPQGAFYIAEEIPGLIRSEDMTWFLRKNGYWGSYNIPYFIDIAQISGFIAAQEKYGDFYSWENTPRAKIFRRDHVKVTDVDSMRALMRYNDWQNDPLSAIPNCTGCVPANSPICAIAARADLIPLDATFGDLNVNFSNQFTFGMWGAPDAKISSYKMINDGFAASNVLSPSTEFLPAFNWNAYPQNPLAYAPGMVQFYNFEPVHMTPSQPIPNAHDTIGERFYVYRASGDGVPAPVTSIPNVTFTVSSEYRGADSLVATVQYNKTSVEMGWDQITVTGNADLLNNGHPLMAWYGAGVAEGYATIQSIKDVMGVQNYTLDEAAQTFVDRQLAFLRTRASDHVYLAEAYWRQVRKQLLQMEGIAAGFNLRAEELGDTTRITMMNVFLINLGNEAGDIRSATNPSIRGKKNYAEGMHCSALIKVAECDVFFGHDMWSAYSLLVGRQYKTYEMETTVSMSSNAMYIASGDDWYITSNKLASMETTNDFFNTSLYDLIVPETTPEFMRVMIANYVATTPRQWTELFAQNHSGTYCNQYMVFDYKQYEKCTPAAELPYGIFWVVEELPGIVRSGDMTGVLRNTSYWASYNIPYFYDIFVTSGYEAKRDQYGSFFDHTGTPRAKMLKRGQSAVSNVSDMHNLMRYNNWQYDEFSVIPNCPLCQPQQSPMLGVASRGDLVLPNNYANVTDAFYANYFSFATFGAIDAKITSFDLIQKFTGFVELGPTHETQLPFSWSEIPNNLLATASGMILSWDFSASAVTPLSTAPPAGTSNDDSKKLSKLIIGIIVTGIVSVVMLAALAYCFLSKVERKGAEYEPLVNDDVQ